MDESPKTVNQIIQVETEELQDTYGVDYERTFRLLAKTAYDNGYARISDITAPLNLGQKIWFTPSLRDALRHLLPEEAIDLFESNDPDDLAHREYLADELSGRHWYGQSAPLYSLDELEHLTNAFIGHLEANRDYLIDTGISRAPFLRSEWFFRYLGRLYYTKLPTTFGFDGDKPLDYAWSRSVGNKWTTGGYEGAEYIGGLDASDITRLEQSRPKLLDLKINVLRELAAAVRSRSGNGLWLKCLKLVTDSLSASEADFFLGMDRFYYGHDILTAEPGEGEAADEQAKDEQNDLIPSGLSDLLYVIGHSEEELTIGQFNHTRWRLNTLMETARFGGLYLAAKDYYRVVAEGQKQELDEALNIYMGLEDRVLAHWQEFRMRVNNALQNAFYEEVIVRTRVKRSLVHKFEPHLRAYSTFVGSYLDSTGLVPQLSLGIATTPSEDAILSELREKGAALFTRLETLAAGQVDATKYQELIIEVFRYLFAPDLVDGKKEVGTHLGTERRDIIFSNVAESGFWSNVRSKYGSSLVMFETKNVSEIELDHINQVAGYLGVRLGMLGFIVTRKPANRNIVLKTYSIYNDTPSVPRKTILILSDDNIKAMIKLKQENKNASLHLQEVLRNFQTRVQ